jgi:hypothetical protein
MNAFKDVIKYFLCLFTANERFPSTLYKEDFLEQLTKDKVILKTPFFSPNNKDRFLSCLLLKCKIIKYFYKFPSEVFRGIYKIDGANTAVKES